MISNTTSSLGEEDKCNDLQLLGEKARQFLYSEGIYSGNDLLRISTGDLGINYKKWHEKNGLKELKSPGGGSSISGWKNIIRTAKGIRNALAFLSSQGIFSSEELLNRSLSVGSANSPLTKALYEWRFEQDNDPKPSPKLRTQQVSYIEI